MNEITLPLAAYGHYITQTFALEDAALSAARAEMEHEGLPGIYVSASEGKLLHLLALLHGARRILEIGTLGGYSGIWLARALPPDGKLISLEIDPHHAEVARRNFVCAGLSSQTEVRVGPALDTLAQMARDSAEPFDLVFIDADKDNYVGYLQGVLPLVREGGVILGDNTLPDAVLSQSADSGTKHYNTAVSSHPNLVSTLVPILRQHGLDGLTLSFKKTSAI